MFKNTTNQIVWIFFSKEKILPELDCALLRLAIHLETEDLLKISQVWTTESHFYSLVAAWHDNAFCWVECKTWSKYAVVWDHAEIDGMATNFVIMHTGRKTFVQSLNPFCHMIILL